jgi:hypothetical protein
LAWFDTLQLGCRARAAAHGRPTHVLRIPLRDAQCLRESASFDALRPGLGAGLRCASAIAMAPSSTYFDPAMRERLRRRVLKHGRALTTLLAEVVSGKDRTPLLEALGVLTPGTRPDEALRKALDRIERRRLLLVSDDARYGCCEICGIDLGVPALEEVPWADRCRAHAA